MPQLPVGPREDILLGVGPLEIGVILLIAFLVLGPNTSIDMARKVGKVVRDLRGSLTDIAGAVDLEKDERPAEPPAPRDQK